MTTRVERLISCALDDFRHGPDDALDIPSVIAEREV